MICRFLSWIELLHYIMEHANLLVGPLFGTHHLPSSIYYRKYMFKCSNIFFLQLTLSMYVKMLSVNTNSLLRYCEIPGIPYLSAVYIDSVHKSLSEFGNRVSDWLPWIKVHPVMTLMNYFEYHSFGIIWAARLSLYVPKINNEIYVQLSIWCIWLDKESKFQNRAWYSLYSGFTEISHHRHMI